MAIWATSIGPSARVMASCWADIRKLTGRRLHTLSQRQPFEVADVTNQYIVIRPTATGLDRQIPRECIEEAWTELQRERRIGLRELRKHNDFNPSYLAAVLSELPGVGHTSRPILLLLNADKSDRNA